VKIVYYYRGIPADTALVNMTEMINALRQVGHEVMPCFPVQEGKAGSESGSGRLLQMRRRVPRAVWNLGQLWADRRGTRRLLSLCESERPDVIHDRYLPLSLGPPRVARRLGIPLITVVHEVPADQMLEKFSPLLRGLARSWERRALQAADHVLAVSSQLRDCFVGNLLPAERVTVMPNGVRAEAYVELGAAREERRRKLGLGRG